MRVCAQATSYYALDTSLSIPTPGIVRIFHYFRLILSVLPSFPCYPFLTGPRERIDAVAFFHNFTYTLSYPHIRGTVDTEVVPIFIPIDQYLMSS